MYDQHLFRRYTSLAGEAQIKMNRKIYLAPSILGANPLKIYDEIISMQNNFDWLHLDIMDGHFVRNLSFGPDFARALNKNFPGAFIDVHLMVDELKIILPLFINSGASLITIHAETEPQLLHAALSEIKNAGLKCGVSICPATPVENISEVLELADLVLIMSVTPGFGGQKFIRSSLEKVNKLFSIRAVKNYNYLIEIDGGINESNIIDAVKSGCDVIVAGSAVFNDKNKTPAQVLINMRKNSEEALKI